MTLSWKRTFPALGVALTALLFAPVASGQARDEYGDVSDVAQNDVGQTVARISHVQGNVSYSRGDDPDDWQPADVNIPMTLGDRVYTDRRSRLELQVHGGDAIWLGSRTDLAALNLTEDTKQFALKSGIGSFQIRRLDEDDTWEVDTPNAAVTFERAGDYRIDVSQDGNTRVSVQRGAATVAAGGGQIALNAGEAIAIDGIDSPRYDVLAVSSPDSWDRWVGGRAGSFRRSASYSYVSADIVGVDDLDTYGSWQHIPEYGTVWSPTSVQAGWVPYRQGHWAWQDPWGWTWISAEPWGWAPYHYGRWVTYSSRWYWVPVAPSVRVVAYAPALVAFVGGGPGFSASVTVGGGGYVGWFPLAPRDPLVAWWAPRPAVNVNVTNVTYINQTYVTVVNQSTFVSSGLVARNIVTDRTVVREAEAAQVIHGAVPVIPTVASTRVAFRTGAAAPRPPAAVVSRSVVTRVAPPPAPPRFQEKLAVIRENRAPVSQAAATRISSQAQTQPRATSAVRPVSSERVTLAPSARSASSAPARAQAVAPVAPVRGRPLATSEHPVAPGPVTGNKSRSGAAAQSAPPPSAQRERVEPSRPETPRVESAQPAQSAPGSNRPTPAMERPQREAAPANRPQAEPQRVPVPPQPVERLRPTPSLEPPVRPAVEPEGRVQPEAPRAQTPDWRQRAKPTAPEERLPTREAPSQRERVQTRPTAREEQPARSTAPERERPKSQQRVVTPPPSHEVVRPESHRPPERPAGTPAQERQRSQAKPRPTPTPEKDRS